MVSQIFHGEISNERSNKWDNGEDNPFVGLKKNNRIERVRSRIDFLGWARKHLSDKIQIDWGAFAWKGTGNDIMRLATDIQYSIIEGFDETDPDKIYGVVFIETS